MLLPHYIADRMQYFNLDCKKGSTRNVETSAVN